MITNRAILKINKSKYDILRFKYGFQRDVDSRGLPCSNIYGGSIFVQIESTEDVKFFQLATDEDMPTVNGCIELLSDDDDYCIRRIAFEGAHIFCMGEQMQNFSSIPMIKTVCISPMRLEFNDMLKIDRRWPKYPHNWDRVKEDIKPVVKRSSSSIQIIDAYWLNEENNKIRDLVTDIEVTLYIVLEDYTVGQTIGLTFEDSNNMGIYRADCSGVVNKDGLLVLEYFKMEKQ